ncbi:hypothetical protein RYZ26_13915 [Terasakiella sp. A23]|uniref:hypothetical protein n=1 Tax=Terasakiella sp. FCG-A23 TaxID=3080561 RepID=UPI0029529F8B|nr:hypothetical protein [Terasakiella sp. A23]MDV7340697.1 hypothetical protein [Terasakiella sp. A23]
MTTFRLSVSADNKISGIASDIELGPQPDGSAVHEIFNCPPEAQLEDATYLLAKGPLKTDSYRHSFADLASGGSSCCGACS